MTAHSTLVGGSIATRRLNCPASYQESLKAPPSLTSVYAEDGTAKHEAMEYWQRNPDDDLVGMTFNDIIITQEMVDTALIPAWDALADLQELYGGNFKVTHREAQVQFPGIPGAFGTVDDILQSPTHFIVADFKFGAGVYVPCTYDNGELNAQLLFYLAGARRLARKRTMVIAIIQPTFQPHFTHSIVTPQQLDAFESALRDAIALATSNNPQHVRGEWCRFANCKATCPLWTGPLLDLTAIGKPPTQLEPTHTDWGIFLSNAKRLVDSALTYQKEIDQALLEYLRAGGKAPGFALKKQVKNRKWLDDADAVAAALKKLGLTEDKIWQKRLQTFAVTDAAAKKLRVEIPDTLRPRPESPDLVLTYEGDPNTVDTSVKVAEFSAALKRLGNQHP